MAQHNRLGKEGEKAATKWLVSQNYKIREHNWRYQGHEVDIIAEDDEYIVFVEVKTRTSVQWGNPEDFVGRSRMRRMIQAADAYLKLNDDADKPPRFDIIGMVWNGRSFDLEHIDDAFLPPIY